MPYSLVVKDGQVWAQLVWRKWSWAATIKKGSMWLVRSLNTFLATKWIIPFAPLKAIVMYTNWVFYSLRNSDSSSNIPLYTSFAFMFLPLHPNCVVGFYLTSVIRIWQLIFDTDTFFESLIWLNCKKITVFLIRKKVSECWNPYSWSKMRPKNLSTPKICLKDKFMYEND